MPKIDLFNLGSTGVDLTRSVVHADDGTLRSAQNAIPDMRGEAGGIAKRDGLTAVNSTTVGGSVKGAVLSSVSSGSGGLTVYVGGTTLWFKSTDGFATSSTVSDTLGHPQLLTKFSTITPVAGDGGVRVPNCAAASYKNRIYFPDNDYTVGVHSPPIHVMDGTGYREFCRMPINPTVGAVSKAIIAILCNEGVLYVAVWEAGSSSADLQGSVYSINIVTGAAKRLGATFPTGYLPWVLTWYQGRLWAGTYSDDDSFSGRVYWFRPESDSAWTLDHTTTAGQGQITALAPYKGNLYASTIGSAGNAALVLKRTSLGVWSTSDTGTDTTVGNAYSSLVVFGDNLYTSYHSEGAPSSTIRKFDNSSWSLAYTYTGSQDDDSHRLFAFGGYLMSFEHGSNGSLIVSTDGSSWNARTAQGYAAHVIGVIAL